MSSQDQRLEFSYQTAVMIRELGHMYDFLSTQERDKHKHACDFWLLPAAKKQSQVEENPVLHEYPAIGNILRVI